MLPPKTYRTLVIRTDFENQRAWETICGLLRAPVRGPGYEFFANVEFVSDEEFRDATPEKLLELIPRDFGFLFVVDKTAIENQEFPILVLELERGRSFRAIPSQIQAIENNLSIANMGFADFADNTGGGGIFRGFADP